MEVKIRAHARYLPTRLQGVQSWKVPESVRVDVLRFVDELALGKANPGKRISEGRQAKYLDSLRVPLEFFGKPLDSLALQDVEAFEKALLSNAIQSHLKSKPYADSTKVDIRKALKIFLRWRLGATKAMELAGWLDTRDRHKTPDYLSVAEIEALLKHCRTIEQRYIVAALFDSGARAEEFLNIRFEDVRLADGKDNFVKIALKQEYSKTLGRTISLFWHPTGEIVQDYVSQRQLSAPKATDPVLAVTYDNLRIFLRRLGLKVLNKPIHPHLFRHSSATHYASQLNRQELCYRYGWKFSSAMPDVYISRAGMENKDLDVKFTGTEVTKLRDELVGIRQEARIKDERMVVMQDEIAMLKRNMQLFGEVMAENPSIEAVEQALRRKRQNARSPQRASSTFVN
jgi:integrase